MKRLFAQAGPGDGLVDKPVRLSALVSFRGEKRKLGDKELRSLVREPVERAADETREAPLGKAELEAVASALWGATAMSPRPETSARPMKDLPAPEDISSMHALAGTPLR
ncbi:hypothetical protein POD33_08155 [Streptomyces moderatus]|nr:hypothetical protein POD33_08155 [Streptomyces moderatus]